MINMDEIEKFELNESNLDASSGPRFSTTMEYDGLVCPDRWLMDFTPLQFEEIAATFRENDTDKSGTIDTSELKTMLHNMDMEYSEANIQELLSEVDKDGSGILDFSEFVALIARMKRGDGALRAFAKMLDVLGASPVNIVEQQAKERDITVAYKHIQTREDGYTRKRYVVYECQLEGDWYELFEGKVRCVNEVKRFQGIGVTNRDAKAKAALAALKKLKDFMPGCRYTPGHIPHEWMSWFKDNAKRGVPLASLLKQLKLKGFVPCKNDAVMQYSVAFLSFLSYLEEDREGGCSVVEGSGSEGPRVRDRLIVWARRLLRMGVDGAVLVDVLQDVGLPQIQDLPQLVHSWRLNEGGAVSDELQPKLLTFWQCCVEGVVEGVGLYVAAGQALDEPHHLRRRSNKHTGLAFAALHNQGRVCEALLQAGAAVGKTDELGRTALHLAAEKGHTEVLRALVSGGAELQAMDTHGNTALHLAARANAREAVCFLASTICTHTFQIVYNSILLNGKTFDEIVQHTFLHFQAIRCPQNETPRFHKEWIHEAAMHLYHSLIPPAKRRLLSLPSQALVSEMLLKYDPDPDCGHWVKLGDRMEWQRTVAGPADLSTILAKAFKDAGVNSVNRMGRTPLHMACYDNLVDSHAGVISDLVERYGVLLSIKDATGKTAYDLCYLRRRRIGSPSGSDLRESLIQEKRGEYLERIREQQEDKRSALRRERQTQLLQASVKDARELQRDQWRLLADISPLRRELRGCTELVDVESGNMFYTHIRKRVREVKPRPKKPKAVAVDPDCSDDEEGPSTSDEEDPSSSDEDEDEGEDVPPGMVKVFSWQPTLTFVREDVLLNAWIMLLRRAKPTRTVCGHWHEYLDSTPRLLSARRQAAHVLYVNSLVQPWAVTSFQAGVPVECKWAALCSSASGQGQVQLVGQVGRRQEWDVLRWGGPGGHFDFYRSNENMAHAVATFRAAEANRDPHKRYALSATPPAQHYSGSEVVYMWEPPLFAVEPSSVAKLCTVTLHHKQKALQPAYTCGQCHKRLVELQDDANAKAAPRFVCGPCAAVCHAGHTGVRYVKKAFFVCDCTTAGPKLGTAGCLNLDAQEREAREMRQAIAQLEEEMRVVKELAAMPPLLAFVPQRPPVEVAWESTDEAPSDESPRVGAKSASRKGAPAVRPRRRRRTPHPLPWGWCICRQAPDTVAVQDWVVVRDPHEPTELQLGWQVLSPKPGLLGLHPGTISALLETGSVEYKVLFTTERPKEPGKRKAPPPLVEEFRVARCALELVSPLSEFYFNTHALASTWDPPFARHTFKAGGPPAYDDPRPTTNAPGRDEQQAVQEKSEAGAVEALVGRYPGYGGDELLALLPKAHFRRRVGLWNEYCDPELKTLFYVDHQLWRKEQSALKLQRLYRKKHVRALPARWYSQAVTYSKPKGFAKAEAELSGWAALQRRSDQVRKLTDAQGTVWEERCVLDSLEIFYYAPQDMQWQWDRPNLPSPMARVQAMLAADLKPGDKVLFRFDARGKEEAAEVIRVVVQDQDSKEVAYDLRADKDKTMVRKWVKRHMIRKVPKSKEEARLEWEQRDWVKQYRAHLAAEERRERRKEQEGLLGVVANMRQKKINGGASKGVVLTEEELDAAKARRAAAEEARRKLEQEVKTQEDTKAAVLQAALRQGANMVQVVAAQSGQGLREAAALLDKAQGPPQTPGQQPAVQKALTSKEHQDRVDLEEEEYLAVLEDKLCSPRTVQNRRLLRFLDRAARKQSSGLDICKWGCGEWVLVGLEQARHERNDCIKRITPCTLGCELAQAYEDWERCLDGQDLTQRQMHEEVECPKRLMPCPNSCGEWVSAQDIGQHTQMHCPKRALPPLVCRAGCGLLFEGSVSERLAQEEMRLEHELHLCPKRIVQCHHQGCVVMVRAEQLGAHNERHWTASGFCTYTVAGQYTYTVPSRVYQLKVQLWGAGGGGGHMREHMGGHGGGGGFLEALVAVKPGERLELTVGGGGAAGAYASEDAEQGIICGLASGGVPGGGDGYSGSPVYGCGGGGGYSILQRHSHGRLVPILVASGGGGGGTRDATGGGGLKGEMAGTVVDDRGGRMGTQVNGGRAGSCPEVLGCRFPAAAGLAWQGGNGCEFGGGGGGGYYGGGGGGTAPGIAGAGGGGSCYVNLEMVTDFVVMQGEGRQPGGGTAYHTPKATGVGDWDLLGGMAGEGGIGESTDIEAGRSGAIRIIKPGFYFKPPPDNGISLAEEVGEGVESVPP